MISTFSSGTPTKIIAGIFVLVASVGFVLIAAGDVLMLMKVIKSNLIDLKLFLLPFE